MMLPLLLAAALGAPPPAAPAFHLGGVGIGARLEVVASPAAPSPPFRWRAEGATLVGIAEDARMQATLVVAPAGPGAFGIRFTVAWRVAAEIEREAVRLLLPGRGRAVRRDLAFAPLAAPLRVDRGTPVVVA